MSDRGVPTPWRCVWPKGGSNEAYRVLPLNECLHLLAITDRDPMATLLPGHICLFAATRQPAARYTPGLLLLLLFARQTPDRHQRLLLLMLPADAHHLSLAGSVPRPQGSKPWSPGREPSR